MSSPDLVALRVVGVDLSLTSSGVAAIDSLGDEFVPSCWHIKSSGKRGDSLIDRDVRITELADGVLNSILLAPLLPVLVMIEGPAYGSRGGSPVDRYGLWWRIVSSLLSRNIPVAYAHPTTRSKFAAGNGKSDKAAVASSMQRIWTGMEFKNSDESDALALAHMAAVGLGWTVVTLARHKECLSAVKWPVQPAG